MTVSQPQKKQRTCIACGSRDAKGALHRVVRSPQGDVFFDATGKASGRGAYVCSAACFTTACKTGKLNRALRRNLGQDDYERIAGDLARTLGEASK